MLCLSRNVNEEIVITIPPSAKTREVRVMLVRNERGRSKLGFVADRDVIVDRAETHEKKKAKAAHV